jgi:hypothetical protein
MTEKGDERHRFNSEVAPAIASAICPDAIGAQSPSERFACFECQEGVVLVGGLQEAEYSDLALAYGLTRRGDQTLLLVLPKDYEFPTLQRAALLTGSHVKVWTHQVQWGGSFTEPPVTAGVPTADEASDVLRAEKAHPSPEEELAKATKALHLDSATDCLFELVEWATRHPHLDAGHRRGRRSWHCRGQQVLSIQRSVIGVVVRAGIHGTGDHAPTEVPIPTGGAMSGTELDSIEAAVDGGVEERLTGGHFHQPDEHWLQSVIRRDPKLVGIEQPALREVPAWRPKGGSTRWGRGYIDLVGLDGHGNIRVVETKLATYSDERLVLQGLDYFIWASVYREALIKRLSASNKAEIQVHYVIGVPPNAGHGNVSQYAAAQAKLLSFPWRFQTVTNWFTDPPPFGHLLPKGKLP